MQVRSFSKGVAYKGGWEINFIGKKYNFRIAQFQIALWKNYEAIFNWTF